MKPIHRISPPQRRAPPGGRGTVRPDIELASAIGNRAMSRLAGVRPPTGGVGLPLTVGPVAARMPTLQRTVGNAAATRILARSSFVDWLKGLDLPSKLADTRIEAPVGVGKRSVNNAGDVLVVSTRLMALGYTDPMPGVIEKYQREVLGPDYADGLVEPEGPTLLALREGRRAGAAAGGGGGGGGGGGALRRPPGAAIWTAYMNVKYKEKRNPGAGGLENYEVWEHVGGRIGWTYGPFGNSCACRVSWALNYGGEPIGRDDRAGKNTDAPDDAPHGTPGDGKRYVTDAGWLEAYLKKHWGPPDKRLTKGVDAKAFRAALGGQVAVFAGPKHAGIIKQGYDDLFVYEESDSQMPVSVWILP